MKVAIYTEDGITQIVLTPDGEFETAALAHLHKPGAALTVLRGSFYECRGGYIRQGANDTSTLLRIDANMLGIALPQTSEGGKG